MGCRQLEAHGQGHQSQAVPMPETRPLQHKLSPARGFEGEAEPGDGAPCPGPLINPGARPGPELSPEEEGAGSLGEEATATSASRSWAWSSKPSLHVCAQPSLLAPRPLCLGGRLCPEGGSGLYEGRSASAEGRVQKSRLF